MRTQPIDHSLATSVASRLNPGVVASVFSRDAILYSGAAGGPPGRPLAVDDVFRIASMTKLVTSVAVLMLVDEGRVSLDATVADYVGDFVQPPVLRSFDAKTGEYTTRAASRDATLRELLSHSGGYGYWFLDEPLRVASGDSPNLFDPPFLMSDPGAAFAYSSSHDVAGLVIEAASGKPIERFFADRIFEPLGMQDTGFELPADPSRLVPIAKRNDGAFEWLENESRGPQARGGGGLYSTLADYGRLLAMLMHGGSPLLRSASAAQISANQLGKLKAARQKTALPSRTNDFIFMDGTQTFGLGVMIETHDQPGRRARESFGWAGIFNSYFWIDPRTGVGAIILMQLQPFSDPGCVETLNRFESSVYANL